MCRGIHWNIVCKGETLESKEWNGDAGSCPVAFHGLAELVPVTPAQHWCV